MAIEFNITGTEPGDRIYVGEDKTLAFFVFAAGTSQAQAEAFVKVKRGTATAAETTLAGTAVMLDVSGYAMSWVLRKGDKTADPALLTKSTGAGTITITGVFNASSTLNTQQVNVALYDTDTAAADGSSVVIPPKTYRYALKRTDAGSETMLTVGDFELLEGTLR
jgi:hypothetical protein